MSPSLFRLARRWGQVGYWVREFFGENAYPRYVAAWRKQHAEASAEHRLLTEREFFSQRLERMYGSDIQRCC